MSKELVPSKTQLRRYLSRGLTQQQIVEAWQEDSGIRVSRSTIAMAIARYGLQSAHPRYRHEDTLPWHLAPEHRGHYDARMLRAEGRRRKGLPLSEREQRQLNGWKEVLHRRKAVVVYDADTEQGFFWVERTERDGDDIIRREIGAEQG